MRTMHSYQKKHIAAFALVILIAVGVRVAEAYPQAYGNLVDFGSGANDTISSNGTNLVTPAQMLDASPKLWSAIYVNTTLVAGTTYGGEVLPTGVSSLTFNAIRFRVTTAGTVGSTNTALRISDGTNNCDCNFPCNVASASVQRIACTGTCVFAAGASVTYAVNSIGNCSVGPIIQGNINVEAKY